LRNIRLTVFIFTAALHGILFSFVSVKYQSYVAIKQGVASPFKLVNIEEAELPKLSKSVASETVTHVEYRRQR
jgi:cell shape-determining protein MreC